MSCNKVTLWNRIVDLAQKFQDKVAQGEIEDKSMGHSITFVKVLVSVLGSRVTRSSEQSFSSVEESGNVVKRIFQSAIATEVLSVDEAYQDYKNLVDGLGMEEYPMDQFEEWSPDQHKTIIRRETNPLPLSRALIMSLELDTYRMKDTIDSGKVTSLDSAFAELVESVHTEG